MYFETRVISFKKCFTSIDEDSDTRDDESSVESTDSIGLEGLPVDVDQAVELSLASLLAGLGVVGQPLNT